MDSLKNNNIFNKYDYQISFDEDPNFFITLEEIGKHMNSIRKRYIERENKKARLKELEKSINNFETIGNNIYLIQIFKNFKEESKRRNIPDCENENMQRFISENRSLVNYDREVWEINCCRKSISELTHFKENSFCEYAVLTEGNKKFILDLHFPDMLNVTNLEKEIYDFIIEAINPNGYLLEITRDDLPTLMEIKEGIDYNPDLSYMDPISAEEEKYLILEDIPRQVYTEFQKNKGYEKTKKHE